MIDCDGRRYRVQAPMTLAHASDLLATGRALLQPGEQVFDFAAVTEADSSAVAVMLGWLRTAQTLRADLRFAHIPVGVRSLAELYGVTDLLPLA